MNVSCDTTQVQFNTLQPWHKFKASDQSSLTFYAGKIHAFYGMLADRTNLAFAALQLNKSLGFSESVYGTGSSVFFLGYSALQIPSNVRSFHMQ